MGCSQSRVEEQVAAPAPASAVAVPEETPAAVEAAPAVAADAAPATEEATPETTAAVEVSTETPAAEVAPESSASVEAAPASSTVSEVVSTEAVASETPAEVSEVTETAAPASEPVAEEPVVEAAPTETAAEPEVEATPAAEEAAPAPEPTVSFSAAGTVMDQNVVFYQFLLVDKEDPAKDTTIRKRFNDFKVLHAEVAKLMASASNVPASQNAKFATYPALPPLPKSGMTTMLLGRKNKNLTADREAQFAKILNAIARHPIAMESDAVKAFLA